MSKGDVGYTKFKSRTSTLWTLANMHRLGDHPETSLMGQPFAGRTVFVVGAGPSLAGNIDALKAHAERGHPVVCVNAAASPLRLAGIQPDVLVARESLDLTDQIEATDARIIAVDIAIHPDTWAAAAPRLAFFVPGYPRQAEIAFALGVRPLFGGPAALCSAVALSMRWGASRIALVGCDLALAEDGTAYHPDAPRGSLRHEVKGEGERARVAFSGDKQDDERCAKSGQMVPPKEIACAEVMAHDWGGVLPTISTWTDQRTWLAIQADRHGERIELLNGTEGGCGVPGWRSVELAGCPRDALANIEGYDLTPRVPKERVKAALESTRLGAVALEQASREMLSEGGPDLAALAHIPGLGLGSPMPEALSAWKLVDRPTGDSMAGVRYTYEAMRDAAREAQRILGARR